MRGPGNEKQAQAGIDWRMARRRVRRVLRLVPGAISDFSKRVKFFETLNWAAWPVAAPVAAQYRNATKKRQTVFAVVGSLGKTTTARATMAVLTDAVPEWIHAADNCFSLVGMNLMRQAAARFATVEVGIAFPGQMARHAAVLQPDVVMVTAIGTDHHWTLGGAERLWEEKALMVRALAPEGIAILNGEDSAVMRMASVTRARVITFGFAPPCNVFADDLVVEPDGSRFILNMEGRSLAVRSRLIGREAVHAQVAAAAAGLAAGLPLETIVARLEQLAPTPGRMQPVLLPNGAVALCDDFKASVETVHAALDVLVQIRASRRVVVLGSLYRPPPPRVAKYEDVGVHLARVADQVILVGSRPRLYQRGWGGRLPEEAVTGVATVEEAVALLQNELKPGDVVLIKGRGEQKLARIALALSGVDVGCRKTFCSFENILCQACPQVRG
jgi:UDP-N-acetylmuramoyl-tripeptide--D-alanyl-D-alanine ligase